MEPLVHCSEPLAVLSALGSFQLLRRDGGGYGSVSAPWLPLLPMHQPRTNLYGQMVQVRVIAKEKGVSHFEQSSSDVSEDFWSCNAELSEDYIPVKSCQPQTLLKRNTYRTVVCTF